jgi:hypothetical protein
MPSRQRGWGGYGRPPWAAAPGRGGTPQEARPRSHPLLRRAPGTPARVGVRFCPCHAMHRSGLVERCKAQHRLPQVCVSVCLYARTHVWMNIRADCRRANRSLAASAEHAHAGSGRCRPPKDDAHKHAPTAGPTGARKPRLPKRAPARPRPTPRWHSLHRRAADRRAFPRAGGGR